MYNTRKQSNVFGINGGNMVDFVERMRTLNNLILEYFINTGKYTAKPKDLMPFLIEKEFYHRDHRKGLPLRNDLRELDELSRLDLIESLEMVRGQQNRNWAFINPDRSEMMETENVNVVRQPGDYKGGTVKLSSILDLRWDNISGGVKKKTGHYYLYGYIYCDEIIEGEVSHSCSHGECPHYIKVCIQKNSNDKEVYKYLSEFAGEKPITQRQPGQIPCTKKILEELESRDKMKRGDLREVLIKSGYQGTTIRNALKTMMNDRRIEVEGFGINQLIWKM